MLQDFPEDTIQRELSRAINKTDFFRAFKMHSSYYGFSGFLVLRLSGFVSEPMVSCLCIMADVAAEGRAILDQLKVADHASVLKMLADLQKPLVWNAPGMQLSSILPSERLIAIPLQTDAGGKFMLILGDSRGLRDEGEMANVIYDFSNILRRYSDSEGLDVEQPKFRKREIEVIEWTAEGKTSADIAIILGLSEYTVNEYIASAMKKLDAVNRIHLVTKAIRLGVIA
jgi:LuxR family transcriptional regulator, quorum-sensing system regulator SdiA